MRKLTVGLAVMSLVLAACGGDDDDAAGGDGDEGGASEGGHDIVLITGVAGDEFYVTMGCGAMAAADELGVNLDIQGPEEFDPSLQTPIVDAVSASQPDAILIAPTDAAAMQAPIQQAAAAGAVIILVDTTLEEPSMAASQIASDNLEGGRTAGEELLGLIGGEGKVQVINVDPGISTTDQRQQGFEEVVEGQEGVDYLGTEFSHNDPAEAASIVSAILASDPDLAGIFATNLLSAEGAANGLRDAGVLGEVSMVGFDAGPAQIEQLERGDVQALVAQQPFEIGRLGVEQAVAAIEGEPVEDEITTGFEVLVQDDLGTPAEEEFAYQADCG